MPKSLIRDVHSITPSMYVGAKGTFFSDPLLDDHTAPDAPPRQATGEITHIKEGPNWAIVSVRSQDGQVTLLRR